MTPLTSRPVIDGNGIVLPIEEATMAHLPRSAVVEGRTYAKKREFHATLLGKTLVAELGLAPDQVQQLALAAQAQPWTIRLQDTYLRLVRRQRDGDDELDHRRSIIQLAEVPDMPGFFDRVSSMVGQPVEMPPAHVTLYTLGNARGIGVYTREQLNALLPKELMLEDLLIRED